MAVLIQEKGIQFEQRCQIFSDILQTCRLLNEIDCITYFLSGFHVRKLCSQPSPMIGAVEPLKRKQDLILCPKVFTDAGISLHVLVKYPHRFITDEVLNIGFQQQSGNDHLGECFIAHMVCFIPLPSQLPFGLIPLGGVSLQRLKRLLP